MKAFDRDTCSSEPVEPPPAGNGRVRGGGLGASSGGGLPWPLAAARVLLVALPVVVAILIGTSSSGSSETVSPRVTGAATVEWRDLVETDTESGTIGYANPGIVYNGLTGTITWLPGVGEVIKPGQTLYEVNGQPVILMDGATPAYRDLTSSDSDGQDILQLNRNLVELGFNPDGIVVDDTWQAATTAGVEALQASLGATRTGSLSLGQVVFLPGDRLISRVDATLGEGAVGNSSAASSVAGARTGTSTGSRALAALIAVLKVETEQLQAATAALTAAAKVSSRGASSSSSSDGSLSPLAPSTGSSASGSGGAPTAILETSSTQLTVTVDLDPSHEREASVGEKVTVEMPAGNVVNGKIIVVSPVAQSSGSSSRSSLSSATSESSSSSGATIPVTITLPVRYAGPGLDQAPVRVNFLEAVVNNVLSVPVTALLATSGGGYAVQEAAAPHALIPVTSGRFAAGYVQVSGPGLYQGLRVTDSQG